MLFAVSGAVLLICLIVSQFSTGSVTPEKPAEKAAPPDPYGSCLLRGLRNQPLQFAELIKQRLRNPSSFEHVQTTPGLVTKGSFPVTMTYRATNGFGAVDTYQAEGEIRISDCAAKVINAG